MTEQLHYDPENFRAFIPKIKGISKFPEIIAYLIPAPDYSKQPTKINYTRMEEKESIKILDECKALQIKKSNDYQNPHSRIRQADYYPRGVATILDIIQAKVLRMYSVIEAMENDPSYVPNFESFEDSCKDLINYASFAAAYSRGKVDGQSDSKDFLNRNVVA
jgi:hypothetical protein